MPSNHEAEVPTAETIEKQLSAFEARYDYPMDYAREVARLGPEVYSRFYEATQLGNYLQGVTRSAWHAARVLGVMAGDCGSCVQLSLQLAAEDGVPADELVALVSGHWDALPPDVKLCAEFTRALLQRSERLSEHRRQVRERFGTEGLVSLAYAAIASGMYPTLKYALGHAHGCTPLAVNGTRVQPDPALTR